MYTNYEKHKQFEHSTILLILSIIFVHMEQLLVLLKDSFGKKKLFIVGIYYYLNYKYIMDIDYYAN